MTRDNRRFQKGSGTYRCSDCGTLTRETGAGESQVELCRECMEESELINAVSDGLMPELANLAAQFPDEKLVNLKKRIHSEGNHVQQ